MIQKIFLYSLLIGICFLSCFNTPKKGIVFSIKNNADGIIFLRNKLKVLWKKNNMDSNLLNTKVHHNH